MRHSLAITICLVSVIISNSASSTEYTPADVYDVDHVTLSNGMNVFLKPRGDAKNISIRLISGVGTYDFPCGKRETPHFLEHLMFEGTSKVDGPELERLMAAHGGEWNASTYEDKTVYDIDIFSGSTEFAIETLYDIISDSQFTDEDVEKSRKIINRESRSDMPAIERWLHNHGIGKSADDKSDELLGLSCGNIELADNITKADILSAFSAYYTPENMTLVIVGQFNKKEVLHQLKQTFGLIPSKATPKKSPFTYKPFTGPIELTGTLFPIVSRGSYLSLSFPTEGSLGDDDATLAIIAYYLSDSLYETLRRNSGISYTPSVSHYSDIAKGLFVISTDVQHNDINAALNHIWDDIDKLSIEKIDNEKAMEIKEGLLLKLASGFESNSSFADFYTASIDEYYSLGHFIDIEEKIKAVTTNEISSVAERYLQRNNVIVAIHTPAFSYFSLLVGIFIISMITIVMVMAKKRKNNS